MTSKKEKTHKLMLDAASQCFKESGYAGIGVDGIAKAAGMTSGAFYAHFGSKDGAFLAVLSLDLEKVVEGIHAFQKNNGLGWVEALVDYYFSSEHQNDLSGGCPMTALASEVVRAPKVIKTEYENKMDKIVNQITAGLDGDNKTAKKTRAWSLLSILIGGLNMMRAIDNPNTANNMGKAFKAKALDAAGKTKII